MVKIEKGGKNRFSQLTVNNDLKIFGKNGDAFTLGDVTHEGGDIKIYRNNSGDLQLNIDADAASNGTGLNIYGGVIAQNYLTVGRTTLYTDNAFFVDGTSRFTGTTLIAGTLQIPKIQSYATNPSELGISIYVAGTDSTNHAVKLQIDENDIIVAQATGDGAAGITDKAIGLYGTTPATQHAAIANATDAATAISQLNLLLAASRAIGLIAT